MPTPPHLFVLALLFGASGAIAVPPPQEYRLLHDDHGEAPEIEQGAGHATCINGVSSGFPCKNVEMLSRLTAEELGGARALESWGWRDPKTGRYYALVGMDNGTSFVDVSDPVAPVYLGRLPSAPQEGTSSSWRDLKTYDNHVFVVADAIPDHGVQVFDLMRLRGVDTPQVFTADAHYEGIGDAHNIAINKATGLAIAVGSNTCDGGLHMIDISDPLTPVGAGCFSEDGYTHDVQCVDYHGPDPDHQHREICFASNEDSLTIVDVTDRANPTQLGKAIYPNIGYSHQGWLSDDQRLFVMGDELDERNFGSNTRTVVFDVANLTQPVYAGNHLAGNPATDHNLYVVGDFVYQANYTAGLRILQIDDLANARMREVAYFDTFPPHDQTGFAGAWNVYPFFDNGTLLVSDINSGLFVLRAGLPGTDSSLFGGGISGAWVAEGLNDQGLTLFVDENINGPVAFVAWFLFLNGEPFWLAGSVQFEPGADRFEMPLQRLEGLEFLSPGAETADRFDMGNLIIHAHGCDTLHLEYDFSEGLGAGEIVMHPVIGVQGRDCSTQE